MAEGEKTPAHQLADEMNALLSRWASTGLVTPMQMADFLMDAQAQTMAFAVQPGKIDESLQAAAELLRHKVYGHVARMAHMRAGAHQEPQGKAN